MVTDLTVGTYWQRGPDNKYLTQKQGRGPRGECLSYTRPLASEGSTDLGLGVRVGVSARTSRSDMIDMT